MGLEKRHSSRERHGNREKNEPRAQSPVWFCFRTFLDGLALLIDTHGRGNLL